MADNRPSWVVDDRILPPSYAQVAERQRELEASQSSQELWKLAQEDQLLLEGGKRAFERNFTTFKADPDFKIGDAETQQLEQEFGIEATKEITKDVTSMGELQFRAGYHRQDIERQRTLAGYGWSGVGASVISALADPVGIATGIVTAPIGGGMKVAGLGRTVKMAAAVGLENAALESVMYAGDTQRELDDVFLSFGVGAVLGGAIGAATRSSAIPDSPVAMVVDAADEFDTMAAKATVADVEQRAYETARATNMAAPESLDEAMATASGQKFKTEPDTTPIPETVISNELQAAAQDWVGQYKGLGDVKVATHKSGADLEQAVGVAAEAGVTRKAAFDPRTNTLHLSADGVPSRAELGRLMRHELIAHKGLRDVLGPDEFGKVLTRVEASRSDSNMKPFWDIVDANYRQADGTVKADEVMAHIAEIQRSVPGEVWDKVVAMVMQGLRSVGFVKEGMTLPEARALIADAGTKLKSMEPVSNTLDNGVRFSQSTMNDPIFDLTATAQRKVDELSAIADESKLAPIKVLGNYSSTSTVLLNSKNKANRGLAVLLLENPQGGAYHGKTASVLSDVNNNIIRSAERNRYSDGMTQFCKDLGVTPMEQMKPSFQQRFNKEVYAAVANGITDDLPPGIKLAAEGIRDKFAKALELRKKGGEGGFEEVMEEPTYVPTIFHGQRIIEQANKGGKQKVLDALSLGYQTGKHKLPKDTADVLAKMQYIRATDATLSPNEAFKRIVSDSEKAYVVEQMKLAKVPDDVIESFLSEQAAGELAESVSNRAKHALGINKQAEVNGVKVMDLLNTNIGELAENYGKEAAAGAAMGRMGFKTQAEVLATIDAAERSGRNSGLPVRQVTNEANLLRDSVSLIYGQTVDADPQSGIVRASRRLRELTGITRLGQMGFAQIPELARAITKMGLGTVLKNVPATGFLRTRKVRAGGTAQGKLLEPELREMEELVGYIGEDQWLTGWSIRHDEFGESADNMAKLSQVADNVLAMGGRLNGITSGFRAIQGGSEKIVYRGIHQRLKQHLMGERTLPKADLDEIGLNEEIMGRLKEFFDAKPKWSEFEGNKVRMMNFEEMPDDLKETVGIAVRRQGGRLIQRSFVGDEGVWMNKWWGKALTQFKGFSIVSLEKQMIHDLRGDKVAAAQIFSWSILLAAASYSAQMNLQAIGREDGKDFLDNKMETNNFAIGVFNKLPQVAALGLGGDALATLGMLPDSMLQGTGRMGFQSQGFGELVASAGLIGDYTQLMRNMVSYATGDEDVSSRQVVDGLRRVVPLMNTIGIGQMTKAATDLLEE